MSVTHIERVVYTENRPRIPILRISWFRANPCGDRVPFVPGWITDFTRSAREFTGIDGIRHHTTNAAIRAKCASADAVRQHDMAPVDFAEVEPGAGHEFSCDEPIKIPMADKIVLKRSGKKRVGRRRINIDRRSGARRAIRVITNDGDGVFTHRSKRRDRRKFEHISSLHGKHHLRHGVVRTCERDISADGRRDERPRYIPCIANPDSLRRAPRRNRSAENRRRPPNRSIRPGIDSRRATKEFLNLV